MQKPLVAKKKISNAGRKKVYTQYFGVRLSTKQIDYLHTEYGASPSKAIRSLIDRAMSHGLTGDKK